MVDKNYIIAYDVGTGGVKAAIVDLEGKVLATTYREFNLYYPRPGWVEQKPEEWWEGFVETTKEVLKISKIPPESILAVAPSGQMLNLLPVDKNGNPLRPAISWLDVRTVKQAEWLEQYAKMIYNITGGYPSAKDIIARVLWLKENEPQIFEKAYKLIDCKDFIDFKLTGNFVTDWNNASMYVLFDIRKREWSKEVCDLIGLPIEKLPEPHPSTDVIGEVTDKAAKETGLKGGTPVIATGGDIASAAVGAGATAHKSTHLSLGTATWIGILTKDVVLDPQMRFVLCCSSDPSKWLIWGEMETGGGAFRWFRDTLGLEEKKEAVKIGISAYDLLSNQAEKVPPGSDGLIFTPWMSGERCPINDAYVRGAFIGLKLGHTKAHMVRAVMEGVAFHIRWIIDVVEEASGFKIEYINAIGGGAQNKLWMQIFADITGKIMRVVEFPLEAGAVGAAFTAAVGLGVYKNFEEIEKLVPIKNEYTPIEENAQKYEKIYEIFTDIYYSLKETYKKIYTAFY
ncbi:MAG: xylulokinase [Thermoprotei archaeon]|nr:MAG: xylulokinase [Thermoprotei archaeon]